jgi:Protein of unknown function (DUF1295)
MPGAVTWGQAHPVLWRRRYNLTYPKEGEPKWLRGPTYFPLLLLGFWILQALWAWFVLLPVTVAQAAMPHMTMGGWGWTGAGLFLLFWLYEATGAAPPDLLCSVLCTPRNRKCLRETDSVCAQQHGAAH